MTVYETNSDCASGVGPVSKYQEFFEPLGELIITFSMLEQQLWQCFQRLLSWH